MPKYQVETDQGKFVVELDQPPADLNQLKGVLQKHLSGQDSPQALTNDMKTFDEKVLTPEQKRQESEFARLRQESATQEPMFKKLAGATIPTIAGTASMLPGVGPLAGAAIQAGGTAFNQLAGQEPYSTTEIAKSAAIPLAAQGAVSAVKGATKALGKFVNPGATRTAGVEAAAENMGATPNTIDRAYTPKASKAGYNAVQATAEEVPTAAINRAVTSAINQLPRANRPAEAERYLQELSRTFDAEGSLPYADIHKQINSMYNRAKDLMTTGNGESGRALMDARTRIIDELDKVSPALKTANDAYRREKSIERVTKVLSNPRPDVKLGETLAEDSLIRSAIPKEEAKMLESIAKQLSTMGTQASPYGGLGGRALNLLAAPLAAAFHSPTGMYLLRQTFKDGKVTPQGLATVAQFMRAYEAQNKGGQ